MTHKFFLMQTSFKLFMTRSASGNMEVMKNDVEPLKFALWHQQVHWRSGQL
ncbi:hypothetical protein Leryth_001345 [Lithospermum erythrorhizon]|nr:hypothetical protein Leryth_001345 [Lithospermum erythrorhizon]